MREFPDTRWSLVTCVRNKDPELRERALSELCEIYWVPVYAFIRSRGRSPHDAEDLTQSFFVNFLRREDFGKSSSDRGRLRSYLLGAVKHYLSNDRRWRNRQKRGGDAEILSIDASEGEPRCWIPDPSTGVSPESIYQRQWATTLLENTVNNLRDRYVREGKGEVFEKIKGFIMPAADTARQSDIARELGASDSAIRVAIHRLRGRYRELLRETVSDTLEPGEDVEGEIRELMAAFSS